MLSTRPACKSVKAFKPPDHSIDGYFFLTKHIPSNPNGTCRKHAKPDTREQIKRFPIFLLRVTDKIKSMLLG